ncbi:ABC-three component system protein [Proteus terrae]|uniref:ABC-three component system protein n=1 Tax=Proteus terrae TaxID=1574161 RepID=UPI001EE707DF|nr:ABC-three component system protein [Proteus terrae]
MKKNDSVVIRNNEITGNSALRDLNIGTTISFNETKIRSNALINLLNRSKQLCDNDDEYRYMIEELQEYLNPRPGRKIIGLEKKLEEGKRLDLLDDATYLENRFARRVTKFQFSSSEEVIYYHCLSKINSSFTHYIKPLFKNTVGNDIVDRVIYDRIVEPLYEEVSEVNAAISTELIRGMIFFLTGKCHIRWVS